MNTLYIVCIVLFFVTIVQTQSGTCDNPLYTSSSITGNCFKNLCLTKSLSSPAAKPQTTICPDIATGEPSCCSQSQYDNFATQFKNAQEAIQENVDLSAAMQNNWGSMRDTMIQDFQAQIDSYAFLNETQKQQFRDAYTILLNAADEFVQKIGNDVASCSRAMLKYLAGFVCLSCRPDYNTYITNGGNGVITYLLDQQTCNGLADGCSSFYDHLSTYFKAAASAFSRMSPVAGVSPTFANPCGNSSCRDYICQDLAAGFYVSSVGGASGFPTGAFKRDLKSTMEFFTALTTVNPVAFNEIKVKRGFGDQSTNQYTANGYPAYSNGDKSGMDTSVQDPSSSSAVLLSWVSYFSS